jgi:hypothetical protein
LDDIEILLLEDKDELFFEVGRDKPGNMIRRGRKQIQKSIKWFYPVIHPNGMNGMVMGQVDGSLGQIKEMLTGIHSQ